MTKQFLIWFAAALVGGLLLLTVGSYLRYGGPPRLAQELFGSAPSLDSASAQQSLRASAPAAPSGFQVLKKGDLVPATLQLPGLDGQAHSMAQYRGQRVLLNFWATWCHPCLAEMPLLAKAQHDHLDQIRVLGVAMDQPAAVRAYLKHTPVDYPILLGLGTGTDLSMRFGDARGLLPYSVLIGADGRIETTHLGKLDAGILQRWLTKATPAATN